MAVDIGAGGAKPEYPLHGCVTLLLVHEVIVAHDDHGHGDPAGDPRLDHNTLDGSFISWTAISGHFYPGMWEIILKRYYDSPTGCLV